MHKIYSTISLFLLLLGSCSTSKGPPVGEGEQQCFLKGQAEFTLRFFRKMTEERDENFLFSPIGLGYALTALSIGAKGGTKEELVRRLALPRKQNRLVKEAVNLSKNLGGTVGGKTEQVDFSVALWYIRDMQLHPPFLQAIHQLQQADVARVDFAGDMLGAVASINFWGRQKTRQRIQEVVQAGDLDPSTKLLVTSSAYIKARWQQIFPQGNTTPAPFATSKSTTVTVPMMEVTATFPLAFNDGITIIQLPYASSKAEAIDLSMILLMPQPDMSLASVSDRLDTAQLESWCESLKPQHVTLALPQFRLMNKLALKEPLSEMGLYDLFDHPANFTGMESQLEIALSQLLQICWFAVDENGTDASIMASANPVSQPSSKGQRPLFVTVNRPFIFLIVQHQTGAILMAGKVVNPRI